jgi:hypothetical protein
VKRVVLILVLASLASCVGARPWEREQLAAARMQLDPDPEQSLVEQHVYNYREGSTGGYGGGGGGCGCN